MSKQNVTLYISDNSSYCNKVINLMKEHDVSFQVKNVTQNRKYMKELQNDGIYGTPALFIMGEEQFILGYQKARILKALHIASS